MVRLSFVSSIENAARSRYLVKIVTGKCFRSLLKDRPRSVPLREQPDRIGMGRAQDKQIPQASGAPRNFRVPCSLHLRPVAASLPQEPRLTGDRQPGAARRHPIERYPSCSGQIALSSAQWGEPRVRDRTHRNWRQRYAGDTKPATEAALRLSIPSGQWPAARAQFTIAPRQALQPWWTRAAIQLPGVNSRNSRTGRWSRCGPGWDVQARIHLGAALLVRRASFRAGISERLGRRGTERRSWAFRSM